MSSWRGAKHTDNLLHFTVTFMAQVTLNFTACHNAEFNVTVVLISLSIT